jgi:ATP-dependent 26S proteasome regulatory subunit
MAEKLTLTSWESNLCSIVRARQPGVVVQSLEEPRVTASVIKMLQWMATKGLGLSELLIWSPASYKKISVEDPGKEQALEPVEFFTAVDKFRTEENDEQGDPRRAVLVLADCHSALESPTNVRMLRETLWAVRGTLRTIIIIGRQFDLPGEVADDLMVSPFDLPTAKDIQATLQPIIEAYQKNDKYKDVTIDLQVIPPFARACAGLPEITASGLLGLAVVRHGAFDMNAVNMALAEKANIVKRSNVLEYETPQGGLDAIGGLENVKAWIKDQDVILNDAEAAKAYGLKMPSGLLLLGVPGTGKSLTARMLAAHWKLPLLRFDVGRAFGSLVGQSEANVRQVIQLANAIGDCVVFCDEVEKALGGRGGEMDGGTTDRVKATFLTWLQEKPDGVFVVMTANDITKFEANPEFLRAGRVDRCVFVDLPDYRARMEILAIHCKKTGHEVPVKDLEKAAEVSKGYSGAELEVAVQTALRAAFQATPRPANPTGELLAQAVKQQKPLSATMKESIERLRAWCREGRAMPAGRTLEDDKADKSAYEKMGLPDLLMDSNKN